jgi:guanylate kinase
MNSEIIILVGFSASGKDTLAKHLVDIGAHFIVSHTTRPMRNGETNGNPYVFITEEEFLKMASLKEFLEHRKYNTLVDNIPAVWHYGVHKSQVSEDNVNVVVLDMLGLREFKKHFGDRCVSFFIDCDVETRRQRCIARGDYNEPEFNRRFEDDSKNFPEDLIKKEIDYIIKSTDSNKNLKEIVGLVAIRRELNKGGNE